MQAHVVGERTESDAYQAPGHLEQRQAEEAHLEARQQLSDDTDGVAAPSERRQSRPHELPERQKQARAQGQRRQRPPQRRGAVASPISALGAVASPISALGRTHVTGA